MPSRIARMKSSQAPRADPILLVGRNVGDVESPERGHERRDRRRVSACRPALERHGRRRSRPRRRAFARYRHFRNGWEIPPGSPLFGVAANPSINGRRRHRVKAHGAKDEQTHEPQQRLTHSSISLNDGRRKAARTKDAGLLPLAIGLVAGAAILQDAGYLGLERGLVGNAGKRFLGRCIKAGEQLFEFGLVFPDRRKGFCLRPRPWCFPETAAATSWHRPTRS